MKKYIYLTLIALSLVPVTSCNKFLDTHPYSSTSATDFYQTAADAELAMASCYNVLNAQIIQSTNLGVRGGLFFMQLQIMLTGSTDEAVTKFGFSDADNAPWGFASWTSNTTYDEQAWFFLYAGIERCNILLEKIDAIPMPDARKAEMKGEARFLRGFYHMYLGMMFGGAPVNTTSTPDLNAPRASVQDVFTQALSDLNYAYTNLLTRATITGRANKWSAAGFLAKTYAFMGACKLNGVNSNLNFTLNNFDWVDATDSYTKVKTITDDIILNSSYTLTPSYPNLFHETTKTYQDQECLFMAEGGTDPANGQVINMQNMFIPNGANATLGGGLGRIVPVGELYAKYNANDTRRTNNLTGALTTTKEVIDGASYYTPNTAITAATIKNNAVYYGGKFRMIDPAGKTISLSYWSGNFPILRLAEIYLLRAEAIFSTTGNLITARADLSTVRARSVLAANLAAVNLAYTKTDFIQELLDERTRELCFEGIRHFDLMRFNRYTSTINALTNDKSLAFNNQSVVTVQLNWMPYRIWFPIPSAELILNKNLIQNPGY